MTPAERKRFLTKDILALQLERGTNSRRSSGDPMAMKTTAMRSVRPAYWDPAVSAAGKRLLSPASSTQVQPAVPIVYRADPHAFQPVAANPDAKTLTPTPTPEPVRELTVWLDPALPQALARARLQLPPEMQHRPNPPRAPTCRSARCAAERRESHLGLRAGSAFPHPGR